MTTSTMRPLSDVAARPVHSFADSFPMLDDDSLDALAKSVASGIREPIVLWAGFILDGRNRLAAATRAELAEVPIAQFDGTEEQAIELVIDLNIHRRHLTPGQKADAAAAKWDYVAAAAQQRMLAGKADPQSSFTEGTGGTGQTRDALAAQFRVSNSYIDFLRKLRGDESEIAAQLLSEIRAGGSVSDALTKWRGHKTAQADPRRTEFVAPEPAVPDEEYQAYTDTRTQAEKELRTALNQPLPDSLPDPASVSQAVWDALVDDTPDNEWGDTPVAKHPAQLEASSTPRERATAEALRQAIELDKHIRSHALLDHDVLDLPGMPHTVTGIARRLADWFDVVAAALEIRRDTR